MPDPQKVLFKLEGGIEVDVPAAEAQGYMRQLDEAGVKFTMTGSLGEGIEVTDLGGTGGGPAPAPEHGETPGSDPWADVIKEERERLLQGEAIDYAPEKMGAREAQLQAFLDMGSYGAADEFAGIGSAASGAIQDTPRVDREGVPLPSQTPTAPSPPELAMGGPGAAMAMGLEHLLPGSAVEEGRTQFEERSRKAQRDRPADYFATQLLTALGTSPPVAMPMKPAQTLLPRMGQAVVQGAPPAAVGSTVAGAMNAPPGERTAGAVEGLAEGQLANLVMGPVGELAFTPMRRAGQHMAERLKNPEDPMGRTYQLFEQGGGEPVFLSQRQPDGQGVFGAERIPAAARVRPGAEVRGYLERSGEAAPSDVAAADLSREFVEMFEGMRGRTLETIGATKRMYFLEPEARRKVSVSSFSDDVAEELIQTQSPEARARLKTLQDSLVDPRTKIPRELDAKELDDLLRTVRGYANLEQAEPGLADISNRLYGKLREFTVLHKPDLADLHRFQADLLSDRDALMEGAGFEARSRALEPRRLRDDFETGRRAVAQYPDDPRQREAIQTVGGEQLEGEDPAAFMREAHNVANELRRRFRESAKAGPAQARREAQEELEAEQVRFLGISDDIRETERGARAARQPPQGTAVPEQQTVAGVGPQAVGGPRPSAEDTLTEPIGFHPLPPGYLEDRIPPNKVPTDIGEAPTLTPPEATQVVGRPGPAEDTPTISPPGVRAAQRRGEARIAEAEAAAEQAEADTEIVRSVLNDHPDFLRRLRVARSLRDYQAILGQSTAGRALVGQGGVAGYADVRSASKILSRAIAGLKGSRSGGLGETAGYAAARLEANDDDVRFLDELLGTPTKPEDPVSLLQFLAPPEATIEDLRNTPR